MEQQLHLDRIFSSYNLTRRDVAEVLGLTTAAIDLWVRGKRKIRAETALKIEQALKVPRYELRPDLWPNPTPAPASPTPSSVRASKKINLARS